MPSEAFDAILQEVFLYKFGSSSNLNPTGRNSINIVSQVLELNMFESIFSPVIKAELLVSDAIGLFVNFPLTGEELVKVSYTTTQDNETRQEIMVIESVTDIMVANDNRSMIYKLTLVSLEAWANARRNVQKAYRGNITDAVKSIYDEFIVDPLKNVAGSLARKSFNSTLSVEQQKLIVIPNLKPFAAIKMLAGLINPRSKESVSYTFYQNKNGYHFKTLQDMFARGRTGQARLFAKRNGYRYISNEIEDSDRMSNDNRIVTAITYNRRHSTLDKISTGYFQNKLFEINMAQKAYFVTETRAAESTNIERNKLNTEVYQNLTPIENSEEAGNRVRYFISNYKENDLSFPVSEKRERWGLDLIAHIALSQIDITVTIPGDTKLNAGELFYMEVPKVQGFNVNDEDPLISGYFLITEKRDTINQNGDFSTSLRLQKDSYNTPIDIESKYNKDAARDTFIEV